MGSQVVFVALCLLPWSILSHSIDSGDLDMKSQFSDFQQTFNRDYKSQEEEAMRFEIFKENLLTAAEKNKNVGGQVYGVTKFSDWTAEEFKAKSGAKPISSEDSYCTNVTLPSSNTPDTLDYVALGKVSPVKSQLGCGSCWAFSAIGQLESQVLIKYNTNVSLSEQQLVDCDTNSQGCDGSDLLTYAPKYLVDHGAELDKDYRYEDKTGQCRYDPSSVAVKVSACASYPLKSEESFLKNVLKEVGPVSLFVSSADLQHYSGGIMTDCTDTDIDHAVLLVGYGTEEGLDYWKLKNSWGSDYGEDGYFRLQRGTNQCQMIVYTPVGSIVA